MKVFRLLSYSKGRYPSLIDVFKCMRGYLQKEIKQLLHLESAEAGRSDIKTDKAGVESFCLLEN